MRLVEAPPLTPGKALPLSQFLLPLIGHMKSIELAWERPMLDARLHEAILNCFLFRSFETHQSSGFFPGRDMLTDAVGTLAWILHVQLILKRQNFLG